LVGGISRTLRQIARKYHDHSKQTANLHSASISILSRSTIALPDTREPAQLSREQILSRTSRSGNHFGFQPPEQTATRRDRERPSDSPRPRGWYQRQGSLPVQRD